MSRTTEYIKHKAKKARSKVSETRFLPYKALQYANSKKNYFEKLAAGADPQIVGSEIARFLMSQPEEWTRLGLDWLARKMEKKTSSKFFKLEDKIQEALTKIVASKQMKKFGGKYPAEVQQAQQNMAFTYGKPWRGRVPTRYKAIEDRKRDTSKNIFDPLDYEIAAEKRGMRTKGRKVTSRKLQERRAKEFEIAIRDAVNDALSTGNFNKAVSQSAKNMMKGASRFS